MRAEDIVYTPLDLPPCPSVDMARMNQWIKETYPQKDLLKYTHKKLLAKHSDTEIYPWDATFAKAISWRNNFDKEFPEIVEYLFNSWKLKDEEILGLILLPKRIDDEAKGFWHSDADRLGLRFYIDFEDTKEDKLLFKKTKVHEIDDSKVFRFFEDNSLTENKIHQATIISGKQPFYINNFAAAHTVFNQTNKNRIAVIVGTAYEVSKSQKFKEKIDNLVVNSALKYHKEAIFWHDWSDGIQY